MLFAMTLLSCRHDSLDEKANQQNNFSASKFRIVALKNIPQISKYIHEKTGRDDLQIRIQNQSTTKSFDLSQIDTSTIVEKTDGENTYYVFGINSPVSDGQTVHNLEVKMVENSIVDINVITYHSDTPLSDDPRTRFDYFTGTVTSVSLNGKGTDTVDYNDGVGGECPPPSDTPTTGGNGTDIGIGTGINPSDLPPPNGGWDTGGGHNNEDPWSEEPTGCWDIITDPQKPWITVGWSNHCNGQYIPNANKTAAGGYTQLTADCGNGSGVIIVSTHNPCEKIKTNFANTKFKQKVTDLDKPEVFDYDHEMGFAAGYPPSNTGVLGTQYPPMENAIGSHTVNLPPGNQYFGFMHTHNNESNGGVPIKIFSPADLAVFLTSCVVNADQSGDIADAYAMVITSEGNYMLNYTGATTNFNYNTTIKKSWNEWYIKQLLKIQNEDGSFDQDKVEKVFVRFLKEEVKIDGVELYKVAKITGKATELTLDANNNILPIPCP